MNTLSPAPLRLASVLAAMLGAAAPAIAQHHDHAQHARQAQDTSKPEEHAHHDHGAMSEATPVAASAAPREPIPAVTAEDLAAAFPDIDHHAMQHAPAFNHKVTFNRLEAWDADGGFHLRKHTIDMPPGTRRSYRVRADALGRWAFHCHLLYHMEAGMMREVRIEA